MGAWKKLYILSESRIDDNLNQSYKYILQIQLSIGEDFTLNIEAEDYDGIVN